MITEPELALKVREIVAETLALDVDDVALSSRFFSDLGGESIDLLDCAFRCEKQFGPPVHFQAMLSPDEVKTDAQGKLTPECAAAIHLKLPSLDLAKIEASPRQVPVQEVLTVGLIVDYMRLLLCRAGQFAPA